MDNWIQRLDNTIQIIEKSVPGTENTQRFKAILGVLMVELLPKTEVSERGIVARFTSLLAAGKLSSTQNRLVSACFIRLLGADESLVWGPVELRNRVFNLFDEAIPDVYRL